MNIKTINKNNIIIIEEEEKKFFSYNSLIAIYNNKKIDDLILTNKWDYSQTTIKYLYQFIIENTNISYRTKKGLVKNLSLDLQQSKNKKKLIQYLIDTKQIKIK